MYLYITNFFHLFSSDRIQSLLMDKNSYIAVLEGMKCHRHRAELQEEGCRAIRGLCIFRYTLTSLLGIHSISVHVKMGPALMAVWSKVL